MYGFATDDSHNYHQFGAALAKAGRGWIMVQAEKLDAASLISAMEAGNFYASTGVSLKHVSFADNQLKVEVAAQEGVTYKIEFIGAAKNDTDSRVLHTVEGTTAAFEVTPDFLFVRAKITSLKVQTNPFMEGVLERAWTQPVFQK